MLRQDWRAELIFKWEGHEFYVWVRDIVDRLFELYDRAEKVRCLTAAGKVKQQEDCWRCLQARVSSVICLELAAFWSMG